MGWDRSSFNTDGYYNQTGKLVSVPPLKKNTALHVFNRPRGKAPNDSNGVPKTWNVHNGKWETRTNSIRICPPFPRPRGKAPFGKNRIPKLWNVQTGNWEAAVEPSSFSMYSPVSPVCIPRPRGKAPKDHNGIPKRWNERMGRWDPRLILKIPVPPPTVVAAVSEEDAWSICDLPPDDDE